MSAARALPERAAALLQQAIALRREQRMAEAADALAGAAALAPDDPPIAFLTAQLAYERGLPASSLFEGARRLVPGEPDILRNQALALASEGEFARGEQLLADALRAHPGWLEGHRVLASLRWTHSDAMTFDAGFAEGCRAQPGNVALRLGWFAAVAQLRDWQRAVRVLDEAEAALGSIRQIRIARAFVASESHDDEAARLEFAKLAGERDDVLDLARIRFHLRHGELKAAQELALPMLSRPVAAQVWPYLALIWRLRGDPRAQWVDGDPPYHTMVDPGFSAKELAELANLLRSLHAAQRPYPEQTVRNGTQTDRSVLLRHEPLIERTRAKLLAAAQDYAAALPPPDPRHPFLAGPRSGLTIGGSWSVRLGPGGHNVAHTHPMGWMSSAFYVSLPERADTGEAPAGHLRLGVAPAELAIDLPALAVIAPAPGKLVLFPSIMWHDTVPFDRGERLNLAFDIGRLPAAPTRLRNVAGRTAPIK